MTKQIEIEGVRFNCIFKDGCMIAIEDGETVETGYNYFFPATNLAQGIKLLLANVPFRLTGIDELTKWVELVHKHKLQAIENGFE